MGGAVNRHKYWACPFFKWDGKQEISCEAGRVRLPDADSANAYMNAFCADSSNWKRCSLAAALMDYYEKAEEVVQSEKR